MKDAPKIPPAILSLDSLSNDLQKPNLSTKLSTKKIKEIHANVGTLSPTYLSNFSTPHHHSSSKHIAIEDNLATLKKMALNQDKQLGKSDHPVTERRSIIDKITEL